MAKISNAKPKTTSGNYEKIINNRELSELITKAQSTVISLGTDLEKKVVAAAKKPKLNIDDFIDILHEGQIDVGVYLFTKLDVKYSEYAIKKKEPDFIIFDIRNNGNTCYIIELKAGDNFDTKKSASEREQLIDFASEFSKKIKCYTEFRICCFNQNDKEAIVAGLKNKFNIDEVLTGKEFCEWIGISYEDIQTAIEKDAVENTEWLVDKIAKIAMVQNKVYNKFCQIVIEEEFYDKNEE